MTQRPDDVKKSDRQQRVKILLLRQMSQVPPHFTATIVLDDRVQNISLNTTVFVYLTTESVSLVILH